MASSDLLYTARAQSHEQIERGRDNLLQQPMYDSGALVAPSSGTITVTDASGTVLVSAAAVTITGSIATYTLPAATVSTSSYGEGWLVVWALAMPDSTTRTVRRSASLVRTRLYPPATSADLFQRVRALNPTHATPITALTLAQYDDYLDACWLQIEERLRRRGRRPWLVLSSESLRELHIVGTLALIFEELGTRNQAAYGEVARSYREQWRIEWADTRLTYDEDDSGLPDDASGDQVGTSATMWLQSFGDQRSRGGW